MSKFIIKEGIVTKFLLTIFDALARGKKEQLLKKMRNDPELAKHIERLDKQREELRAYIENKSKFDPEFKKNAERFDKIYS